jgi:hypothetical protein
VPILQPTLTEDVTTSTTGRPPGISAARLGVVCGASFLLATVLHAARTPVLLGTVVMAAGLALGCRSLSPRYALAASVVAWGLVTGFVVNDGGQLTFAAADVARLALLSVTGVGVAASCRLVGSTHRP